MKGIEKDIKKKKTYFRFRNNKKRQSDTELEDGLKH